MVDGVDFELGRHRRGRTVGHLVAVHAQAHPVQARGIEVAARLFGRKETRLAKSIGVNGAMPCGQRNHLVDQIVDESVFAFEIELRRQRVRAKKRCDEARHVGILTMRGDQIEQRQLAGTMQRVPRLRLQRRRAVAQYRSQARANRRFVKLLRVEQRITRSLDRVAHPERRGLAALARGKVGLAIARIQRMRVRVDESWEDYAVAEVADLPPLGFARGCLRTSFDSARFARCAQDDILGANCGDDAVVDAHRGVVDAAERGEINAALRSRSIARDDRFGADDQRRQSMPSRSAVSMAIS